MRSLCLCHEVSFVNMAAATIVFKKPIVLMAPDAQGDSLKIVRPSVSTVLPHSHQFSFISKIQRFICWKVTEEPA